MGEVGQTAILTYGSGRRTYLSLWRGLFTSRVSMIQLCEEVAEANGISVKDIRGASRLRDVAWPRQEFMALAIDAGYSSSQVGWFLGGRNHSTCLHGAKRHWEREVKRLRYAA